MSDNKTESQNHKPAFMVKDIVGKGKGVVAQRSISSGEVVLSEPPLFTQSVLLSEKTIANALLALPTEAQRQYLSLHNCHRGKLSPLLGIFKTNVLPYGSNSEDTGESASKGGIFLLASRFNSSCRPNVINFWDDQRRMMMIRALRDIAPDEELCICYITQWATRDTRRRKTKEKFGFDCACDACSLQGDDLKASDERRITLLRLYEEIGNCSRKPSFGLRKVKHALRLLKEEGILEGHEDSFCYDGFQFCVAVGDAPHAKAWITRAWEARCRWTGSEDDTAQKYKRYIANPRAHPAWGIQPSTKLSGPD